MIRRIDILSGMQPTGSITLGNYLGALKNWKKFEGHSNLFFIADLHSITAGNISKDLHRNIMRLAAAYVASGLNLDDCAIFQQSEIHEHLELAWVLSSVTQIGKLNRMTQFKEKSGADKEGASLALFGYPVLMAADILLYGTSFVPVGEDQTQHVELVRDIASAFNIKYNTDFFVLPQAIVNEQSARIMSLRDGNKKMSKSDESDFSRINITDSDDAIAKKISKAKTDSIGEIYFDKENRPETSNLISIYAAILNINIEDAVKDIESYNMSQFKETLSEVIIGEIAPIRDKIFSLENEKNELMTILKKGKDKAKDIASHNIKKLYKLVGFSS